MFQRSDVSFIRWMIFRFLLIASEVWRRAKTLLEELGKKLSSLSKELQSTEALALMDASIMLLPVPLHEAMQKEECSVLPSEHAFRFVLDWRKNFKPLSCTASTTSFRSTK